MSAHRRTRNEHSFWYCLYEDVELTEDEDGNESGNRALYAEPVRMYANISPATGYAQTEQFGTLENYSKVIVTHDMDCPINEDSILFVDKEPEYNLDGDPMPDYTVRRVAKSLNHISIAIQEVSVS